MKRRDLSSLPLVPREESSETWDLLGPEGRIEGRFTTHPSVNPRVLTDSRLYAIVRDEMDIQYIVGYRILPAGN